MIGDRHEPERDEFIPGVAYLLGAIVLAGLALFVYAIALQVWRSLA